MLNLIKNNKGIMLSILASILLIVVAIWVRIGTSGNKKSGQAELLVKNVLEKSLDKDSDNDGLKNWEEAIYGTDPGNADSDGDGTNDGDEVSQGRNPLVAGPNDKESIASTTESILAKRQMNATDEFSINLFTEYINAKESGQAINDSTASQIAQRLIDESFTENIEEFDPRLIKTSNDTSIEALRNYGNQFGAITKIPLPSGTVHESVILDELSAGNYLSDNDRKSLNNILERYNKMRDALISMTVPAQVVNLHASFLTGLDQIIQGVHGMIELENDPIGSYSKIALYGNGIDYLQNVALDYRAFFRNKNIIFLSTEDGYQITS